MFYIYEVPAKVLVIQDNINKVPADITKVEAVETIEDIPFNQYDYYDLPPYISTERINNRIREPEYPILEKDPLTPPENKYGVLIEG